MWQWWYPFFVPQSTNTTELKTRNSISLNSKTISQNATLTDRWLVCGATPTLPVILAAGKMKALIGIQRGRRSKKLYPLLGSLCIEDGASNGDPSAENVLISPFFQHAPCQESGWRLWSFRWKPTYFLHIIFCQSNGKLRRPYMHKGCHTYNDTT